MKFDRPQTVSFKSADDGDYVGVIVGFCFVGLHPTKEWGPKRKCMLRWELRDLNPPHELSVDEEGLTHVVTQTFPATIQGESSWLHKALVAHGIITPAGGCADSRDWYGKVAVLSIEGSPGSRSDRVFMNVTAINPLDHDVNIKPTLSYDHWEPDDAAPPPSWAKFMIERSQDLYHRLDQGKGAAASPRTESAPRPGQTVTPGQAATSRSSNPPSSYRPYQPGDEGDEEDIPFNDMIARLNDDIEGRRSWVARRYDQRIT